jgi:hypothetical protein
VPPASLVDVARRFDSRFWVHCRFLRASLQRKFRLTSKFVCVCMCVSVCTCVGARQFYIRIERIAFECSRVLQKDSDRFKLFCSFFVSSYGSVRHNDLGHETQIYFVT